ncbi:AbrB/MazE/SpoVT family DNA-binding domain-containing protein [Methanobacterium spitsbergense]|uniref:Type II toxin-antitoxin system PrlF family antitoxin n=1 Tax=Methanobacterium spitsbergense TaxID=2874285 RepID=A0A8T5V5D6_9EURY|nr:type II toxin-antitoxin system PrlF family antitoxin [Methanobacterium spitsbergense]MBZ2167101.1 type II toxin-antitoxin system PrlF family antitoxin [Methanobacterium spitsbergense]
MVTETKISKGFQTVVPSKIRKMFNVDPGDIVEWKTDKNNRVEVFFRKKITINDVLGMIDGPKTDSVEMKKRIQRGEKI